ncbi:hypothetical protein M0R45_012124 [Rubus argutus]|uniref:Uncharacterized protein n=1 Tax=Rubus argutus TaxID=59490 RepID=A0AAW1YC46_RUBAR
MRNRSKAKSVRPLSIHPVAAGHGASSNQFDAVQYIRRPGMHPINLVRIMGHHIWCQIGSGHRGIGARVIASSGRVRTGFRAMVRRSIERSTGLNQQSLLG